MSVFFSAEGDVFHTYSTYARGTVRTSRIPTRCLDLTPYGRQQDFEESPAGWPQVPTYGLNFRIQEYSGSPAASEILRTMDHADWRQRLNALKNIPADDADDLGTRRECLPA